MDLTFGLSAGEAYERCLGVTRREAKNFYYGIRLLRPAKRQAMGALYAFARYIDDIGDGDLSSDEKLARLAELRLLVEVMASEGREVGLLSAGEQTGSGNTRNSVRDGDGEEGTQAIVGRLLESDSELCAITAGVVYAAREFPIPVVAFEEIIRGCEDDSQGVVYETIEDTVAYCRLVAGSVGRLSLGVFGSNAPDITPKIADDLGVALQLTNILRDIAEDSGMGRVYLPAEDIRKFGCSADLSGPRENVSRLVMYESDRALEWFAEGFKLLDHLDRRSRACVGAMSGIYFKLLHLIRQNPAAVLDTRMSVPTKTKATVATRSLLGLPPN